MKEREDTQITVSLLTTAVIRTLKVVAVLTRKVNIGNPELRKTLRS